ncbi:MAG: hypothetical protein QFE16_00380 [Pseudomonadota bacterium]|nr:hypothetical protein [Pseudomonadota bacterium]
MTESAKPGVRLLRVEFFDSMCSRQFAGLQGPEDSLIVASDGQRDSAKLGAAFRRESEDRRRLLLVGTLLRDDEAAAVGQQLRCALVTLQMRLALWRVLEWGDASNAALFLWASSGVLHVTHP